MTDVNVVPPGQARLFAGEPTGSPRLQVVTCVGRLIVTTSDLAAAVIAAASVADGAWVVAADRWSVRVARADVTWSVATDGGAPVDAIRRVLALIPTREELP